VAFEAQARGRNGDRGVKATPEAPQRTSDRPTIGLALGGGGARGFAHIGVIRTLLTHGIEPDIIVGTSIGAVVGGCFAAGRLDVLDQWCRSLTKRGILSYLDISIARGGLIGGNRLAARLEENLGDTPIEALPIRFATICTEIGTGHEIWLSRGRLVDAMRASYALPGVFPPIALEGRWLVDGALVNPVPVSAGRVLGARLVIAVNVNSDIIGRSMIMAGDREAATIPADILPEQSGLRAIFGAENSIKRQFAGSSRRPSLPSVMIDAFNIMQDRIARARLAGDPPDVMITPRLGRIGFFDFHRAQDIIEHGARAAERELVQINDAIATLAPRPIAPEK
jgi:NTE family protein